MIVSSSSSSSSSPRNSASPIGVAILGSGIFVREVHAPHLVKLSQEFPSLLTVRAVYSRTIESVKGLVDYFKKNGLTDVKAYYENDTQQNSERQTDANGGESSFEALLSRSDIQAVVIGLPIPVLPFYVEKCLQAGKHVLSEKPIAATVEAAQTLIELYERKYLPMGLIWSVAENWRCDTPFLRAAELLSKNVVGKIHVAHLRAERAANKDNKYLKTSWRAKPEYDGGFLLDGGVHFIAAFRLLIQQQSATATPSTSSSSASSSSSSAAVSPSQPCWHPSFASESLSSAVLTFDVSSLGAVCSHLAEFQPGPDTLVASVKWSNQILSTIAMSFGLPSSASASMTFTVIGDSGKLSVTALDMTKAPLVFRVSWPAGEEDISSGQGVRNEWIAFMESVQKGQPYAGISVREALEDLRFVELALKVSDRKA